MNHPVLTLYLKLPYSLTSVSLHPHNYSIISLHMRVKTQSSHHQQAFSNILLVNLLGKSLKALFTHGSPPLLGDHKRPYAPLC